MRVWLGTAGFSYPAWVGPVYPPGTPATRLLAAYARHFPIVEINSSFYRCPTAEALARLRGQVGDGFRFAIKVPRTISHEENDRELPAFIDAVRPLAEGGRFALAVVQFPPQFRPGPRAWAWLERIRDALAPLPWGVEFRHARWAEPAVRDRLRAAAVPVISVDVPAIAALYPRGLVFDTPLAYVRLHSRNAAAWYGTEQERHDFDYPDDVLHEWIEALAARAGEVSDAYLLFNNCRSDQAVTNAKRAAELLAARPDVFTVVPPAPRRERQPSLFDAWEASRAH